MEQAMMLAKIEGGKDADADDDEAMTDWMLGACSQGNAEQRQVVRALGLRERGAHGRGRGPRRVSRHVGHDTSTKSSSASVEYARSVSWNAVDATVTLNLVATSLAMRM